MNHMNHTALHEAVRSGQFELVRSLIGKDAELATIVKEDDESAESPLCMAIRRRFFQIAEFLISSNKFSWRGPKGTTALHYAVLQKQSGIIQMLLERRPAMAREVDAEKCTPLHIAACIGYHKEARLLMEFDGSCADVRNKDHMLALHIAAHQGHINVIKVLTEYRPDLCNSCDDRGWNALHFAAKYGMVEVAQYIVNSPVFMGLADKTNNQRKLPFHLAQGNMVMRSILLLPEQSVRFWCFSSKGRKRKKYENLKGIGRYVALMEHEPKEETEPNENNINSDPWKERSSIHLLVSTIITTVAFAAGITIPGGYINDGTDQGMPTLSRKAAFKIFMVANSLAFSLSISSMRIHFKGSMQKHYGNKVIRLLNAIPYIRYSMVALVVAFVSGTYAILANSSGLAIAVCIICSFICTFGSSVYRVPKWEVKKLKA
ncbi:PREDICTED: ankyrin repeat-containing protein ITN1-like [Nelumbo nucifera]|uniref:Ankyrin repeat-containing protein ITN1-like n=2 Tax=Nelumbo nucifera TaxID=4432 RepID=A0A1U7ZFW8_NELNU|nr:PREDICTED: ankyrin repeat-containing protein ITN1-like [Nelumbo nucifera]DAD43063.1 TPA_asm: hypothetical protein HUJ06_001293 [Nelumbo nucifera]